MDRALRISLLASLLAGTGILALPRRYLRVAYDRVATVLRPKRNALILIWIVALIPMLRVTYLVRHYSVECPTLDDWEMAPLIVDAHTGHLKWADIFAQQQEARTVVPKLIFILSAAVRGHWDVRDQMMLSVVCCWLTAIGIFILLRRSGLTLPVVAVSFWLAVLTIFSLAQYELWIFASGFPSFFPALFLVGSLVIVGTERLATRWKFIVCGILATASTYTLAHGLLAWGLTFPLLLLELRIRRRGWWLAGWAGLCGLCVASYFWSYQKPAALPAFAPSVSWGAYIRFILEFLGGGLAYSRVARPSLSAGIFGAVLLGLFLLALVYALLRLKDRAFIKSAGPWLALGFYSILSGVLASLGRVGYGPSYALASRYVTFSLYLTVAVIALVALVIHRSTGAGRPLRSRVAAFAIGIVAAGAYLIPFQLSTYNTRFFLRALSAKDRLARAAVLFSPALDTSEVIKKTAYPNDARPAIQGADALDRLNLLRPRLIRATPIDALPNEVANGRQASGSCETVTETDGSIRAAGWAVLDSKNRPADCVAVAYESRPGAGWVLCAISDSFAIRADIAKRPRTVEELWSGWSVVLPRETVPAGTKLSFWAVDADLPRLYRLNDESAALTH